MRNFRFRLEIGGIAEAWPSKYDPMDLNAKGNDVAIETLELVNEGVQRVA